MRSVLECCSVIWGGAAAVHTERIDRTQHKFIMWLNTHSRRSSLSYADLLKHFRLCSLAARRKQHEIMFLRNVMTGRIRSSFLMSSFSFSIPARTTRQQTLFHVRYARVNMVREGLFVRLPKVVNGFLAQRRQADVFCDSFYSFRALVIGYVFSL